MTPEDILSAFKNIFDTVSKQVRNNSDDYPVIDTVLEEMNAISEYYGIVIDKNIIRSAYLFRSDDDYKNFIIGIASFLNMDKKNHDAIFKLIRLVLYSNPEHFGALSYLETQLGLISDTKEYFDVLKKIIEIGTRDSRDINRYKFRLSEYERPAKNIEHAATIAYYENKYRLKQLYPKAYICCDSQLNELRIYAGHYKPLPENEIIKIDSYEILVHFYDEVTTPL